jgi:hypothetical protein
MEREMTLTIVSKEPTMSLKRCLSLLLTVALIAAASSVSSEERYRHLSAQAGTSSTRQRIYPLQFDPAAYDVWSFATMRYGQSAILASNRTRPKMLFDEFFSGRQIHVSALNQTAYLRVGAVVDGPSTQNRIFPSPLYGVSPPQEITWGDRSITFIPNNPDNYLPAGLFDFNCELDPAASYMKIQRGNIIENKVLFYVFAKPIHPVAVTRCDAELFAPPHDSIRIIDPTLIARISKNGDLLLAGGSYVSMPVVVSVPSGHMITGNGTSLFVVEKTVVDDCYLSAINAFENKVSAGTVSEHQSAELAALIEKCLLGAIRKKEPK